MLAVGMWAATALPLVSALRDRAPGAALLVGATACAGLMPSVLAHADDSWNDGDEDGYWRWAKEWVMEHDDNADGGDDGLPSMQLFTLWGLLLLATVALFGFVVVLPVSLLATLVATLLLAKDLLALILRPLLARVLPAKGEESQVPTTATTAASTESKKGR